MWVPNRSEGSPVITYSLRWIRRLIVFVVGLTVLLIGVAMIVLPGPAILVIPAGLGVLALEFAWAQDLLTRYKHGVTYVTRRIRALA